MQNFTEKKALTKLSKYLTDRDTLAALALKNATERHTRHLKRDEVGKKTMEMQSLQSRLKLDLQKKNDDSICFMETFSGDPMHKAYLNRSQLHSARDKVLENTNRE